jgi:HEAT repeat protein
LRNTPENSPWTINVMRKLAGTLHEDRLPLKLRGRILTSLALSANSGIPMLMRQMIASTQPSVRQLGILGCGMLQDVKSVGEIIKLIDDHAHGVSRAAVLALVAIGDKTGMETVAYALLQGEETLRRAAAEALTNDPEEGYPTLEEGSGLEDPGVRKAVVYGLGRTRQPWAIEILEKLRVSDTQWIVQDAATQVLDNIQKPNPRLPSQLPPLTHTAWLIAFAGERGMGVAPGKPAYDLLYQALRQGKEDQQLAAIYFLSQNGNESSVLPLYQSYFSTVGEIREAAFSALWNLASAGIPLPPPVQYGLKS